MPLLSPDAKQFSETAMQYGGEETYKVYVEEGLTELPYERWVQVRTPAFKAEFGDWELAKNNRIVRVTSDKNEVRNILLGLRGTSVINQETGMIALLSRKSSNKILSSKAFEKSKETSSGYVHLYAAANVDILYMRGVLGWVKPDMKQDPNTVNLSRMFTPFFTNDQMYLAQTTVKSIVNPTINQIYTIETLAVMDTRQIEKKIEQDYTNIKKGNIVPVQITTADLDKNKLTFVGPHNVSRVVTIAEQVIEFNSKPIKSNINPETGEPTIDFLKSHIPSPLIDLSGLGNREAARKLHDMTGGDIAHLPLITASVNAAGKRINIDALKTVQNQHRTIKQETWLKAVSDAPHHTQSRQKDNTR